MMTHTSGDHIIKKGHKTSAGLPNIPTRQLILRHKQELPNRIFPPEIEDRNSNRALRPMAYAASRPGSQFRGKVCIDRGKFMKLILDGKVFTI